MLTNVVDQGIMPIASVQHSFYIERILQGTDRLIDQSPIKTLRLSHQLIDLADIRWAHPTLSIKATGIHLAE